MRGTFKLEKPGEVEATLTVTAPVRVWKELRDQLQERYPSWDLARIIGDLVSQAEASFYSDGKSEP